MTPQDEGFLGNTKHPLRSPEQAGKTHFYKGLLILGVPKKIMSKNTQQAGGEANWQALRFVNFSCYEKRRSTSLCQCKSGDLFQHYGLFSEKWFNQPWWDYTWSLRTRDFLPHESKSEQSLPNSGNIETIFWPWLTLTLKDWIKHPPWF